MLRSLYRRSRRGRYVVCPQNVLYVRLLMQVVAVSAGRGQDLTPEENRCRGAQSRSRAQWFSKFHSAGPQQHGVTATAQPTGCHQHKFSIWILDLQQSPQVRLRVALLEHPCLTLGLEAELLDRTIPEFCPQLWTLSKAIHTMSEDPPFGLLHQPQLLQDGWWPAAG